MKFRHDGFDVWVFRRCPEPRYLLLRASDEKAHRWFAGSQFWQVPSDFIGNETVVGAITAELGRYELQPKNIWAAEHTYTIYNRRYEDVIHIAVFAAEVDSDRVELGAEHSESTWLDADAAAARVAFRGLKEGLHWVRHYVTESESPLPELRLV